MLLISLRAPFQSDDSFQLQLDQFQQMRSIISTFLGARQDPTPSPRQSFCNYLHSEIKHLEERDFLTFRNETVKLLSEIQYKAKECKRQVTTSQQVTTFQLPEATQATAGLEYILTMLETQAVSIPVVQPTQIATTQPAKSDCQSTATIKAFISVSTANFLCSLGWPTAWDFQTDDFQPTFSCSFTTGGKSEQHFWSIQSLWSYSQCTTVPVDQHTTAIFTHST